MTSARADDQYAEQKIEKHLQEIFNKNLALEKRVIGYRYLPFGKVIIVYIDFSKSISNQKNKRHILEGIFQKYAEIMHCTFKIKYGSPPITRSEKGDKSQTVFHDLDAALHSLVYMKFVTKDELFQSLNNGFWHSFFENIPESIFDKYIKMLREQKEVTASIISVPTKQKGRLNIDSYKLVALSAYRDKYFHDYVEKELYLTFLGNKERANTSVYISPSTFNVRYDDFSKPEISKFDWVLLDEFYNNKSLNKLMYYRDVIPILAKAIAKRMEP